MSFMEIKGRGSLTVDRSGSVTTGGVAQNVVGTNIGRSGFWIQNLSNNDLWINDLTTATGASPDLKLVSGALYESPIHCAPTTAVSVYGATTGQSFAAREW